MESRLLLVDDDPDTREMMEAVLTGAGYPVATAGSFHGALDALAGEPPRLLITDVRLGGYNGIQLLVMSPTPVPAIVITGFEDPVLESEARRLGAQYLVKPVEAAVLVDTVEAVLSGTAADPGYATARRWMRKAVTAELAACVGEAPARIIDVSYGGVCFEVERTAGSWLPLSFEMQLPDSRLAIGVDVVWKARRGESRWLCGARVAENRPRWRELVDHLP